MAEARQLIRKLADALYDQSAEQTEAAMEALAAHDSPGLRAALRKKIDGEDETLLHVAGREANAALLRRLIGLGADVQALDDDGDSALPGTLNAAAWMDTDEAALVLIEAGAPVNGTDRFGLTPLHHAAGCSGGEVVAALIERGAELEAVTDPELREGGHRPLHEACVYGNSEAVKPLLGAGAQIDAQAADGATALFTAIEFGHPATAKRLLEAGADVSLADARGRTPLHQAAWLGEVEVLADLFLAGGDPDLAEAEGWTPREILSAFEEPAFFAGHGELGEAGPAAPGRERLLTIYFKVLLSNQSGRAEYEPGSFLSILHESHRWLEARRHRLMHSLVEISRGRSYAGFMPCIVARIGFDLFQSLSLAYHSARNPDDGYDIDFPDQDLLHNHFEDAEICFYEFFSGLDGSPHELDAEKLAELEVRSRLA